MLSHGVVSLALIVTVMRGAGLLDQDAMAGRLMTSVRRVISPFRCLMGFVECNLARYYLERDM